MTRNPPGEGHTSQRDQKTGDNHSIGELIYCNVESMGNCSIRNEDRFLSITYIMQLHIRKFSAVFNYFSVSICKGQQHESIAFYNVDTNTLFIRKCTINIT